MLATAASYYIKLWNLSSENDIVSVKEKSSCMPHGSSNVLCMEWTQDSSLIGTSGSDGCLVLCIPETGIFSEVIPTGRLKNSKNDEIHSMKFYNKSKYIVFGGSGKIVKCWDRQHNKFLKNYTSHTKTITSLDVNHSENCVSSVSENGDILINSLETDASMFLNISKNPLNKIIYSKNSNTRVFTIDDHGYLFSYDTINLEVDNEIKISDSLAINDITVSPLNNNILITANEDGTITFVDTQSKNIVNTYKANDPLTSVSVRIDGSMLACGTSRGQVLLYDIRMNKQLHKFWAETKAVQALRFQKNSISSNTRKRTPSITLENSSLHSKKHMLSSESEEFNKSVSLETLSPTIESNITTPKKPHSTISTDGSNDITSNLLSAFTTPTNKRSVISRNTPSNFFPSNINPPFDYNFSKNKSQKLYTNPNLNENNNNNSNNNEQTNSVLTFTDFIKNNYSKSTTSNKNNNDINQSPNLHDKIYSSKMQEISLGKQNKNINNNDKGEGKEKMDIDNNNNNNNNNNNATSTATFNDIWLNPSVFTVAPEEKNKDKNHDISMNSTIAVTELSKLSEKSSSGINDSSIPSYLTSNTDNILQNSLNETIYNQYINIDENTNNLREKLKNNIKDELQKNGVTITDETNKLDEGMTSISNKILESVVDEGLQELKSFLRNDIKNMHLEIISQFHYQKYKVEKMFKEQQEKIGPLLKELQKLREENERLKCNLYKS